MSGAIKFQKVKIDMDSKYKLPKKIYMNTNLDGLLAEIQKLEAGDKFEFIVDSIRLSVRKHCIDVYCMNAGKFSRNDYCRILSNMII